MIECRQCHNKHTSGKGERKRNGTKSSPDKDDEFIPSSSKKPKSVIAEIGMENHDVETIEQIQDHEPSIIDSEDDIV